MKDSSRNRILKQLFDIKPVKKTGELDIETISKIREILDLKEIFISRQKGKREGFFVDLSAEKPLNLKSSQVSQEEKEEEPLKKDFYQKRYYLPEEHLPSKEELLEEIGEIEYKDRILKEKLSPLAPEVLDEPLSPAEETAEEESSSDLLEFREDGELVLERPTGWKQPRERIFPRPKIPSLKWHPAFNLGRGWLRSLVSFIVVCGLVSALVPSLVFIQKGLETKGKVMEVSALAYQHLQLAQKATTEINLTEAESQFQAAYQSFVQASHNISQMGQVAVALLENLPGGTTISSGQHLLETGKNIALAGEYISKGIKPFLDLSVFNNLSPADGESSDISLTEALAGADRNLTVALDKIVRADKEVQQVEISHLPIDVQDEVKTLQEGLPKIKTSLAGVLKYSGASLWLLGGDNPRKYLFLFQNNSEMRATGGFIGTYGVLDVSEGKINKIFVEGIYNPDGQLQEKVIPPKPIQKISAAWSMHDANWFADFPTSAQKIAWFYEKTGGPTVDGIIALTPTVMEKLLEITGPIEMPDYDITVNADNFLEVTQYKVEVDYDEELNRPKQFIADLTPKVLDRVFNADSSQWLEIFEILNQSLKERHILLYFFDQEVENIVAKEGWAGQVLETNKDYLSIIHSNISGYKTDAMIDEDITHQAEIQPDGSIIDTVTIHRFHRGGKTDYDWWNRVNADYMRVFVPKGSELLEAKGHTREEDYPAPVDYSNFKTDPDVSAIETGMIIDPKTGTRISQEAGKTVFGNWVYLSPQEEVTVTYKYKLPFKIDTSKAADNYSLLVQKQAGSLGSELTNLLKFPDNWQIVWKYPDDLTFKGESLGFESKLNTDKFYGVTITYQ